MSAYVDIPADMLTKGQGFSKVQHLCALIGLTLVVTKQPSTHASCSGGREQCSDDVHFMIRYEEDDGDCGLRRQEEESKNER